MVSTEPELPPQGTLRLSNLRSYATLRSIFEELSAAASMEEGAGTKHL